jgi:ABC-type multidrug transport system fused ATPase/permease subunit
MNPIDGPEVKGPRDLGGIGTSIGLLKKRHRLMVALMTFCRIAVGVCDLLMAAAIYLLFLLLQGRSPEHTLWWAPHTSLSAAVIATVLVFLRGATDLLSSRFVIRQVQGFHTDLLLRLTEGYSRLQWSRFVECNRSELFGHALHTTREAADFYYRGVELISNVVVIAVMIVALVYQSYIAACSLGGMLAVFYGGHRLLARSRLQDAASNREISLRTLQRNMADMFSSGKEIRTYGNHAFFQERIHRQAERVAASNLRIWFLPQISRIVADQGAVFLFLGIIIVVQLRQGDVRQLLSLLVFYFVLSRRLLPLISQISFIAGQIEGSYENVKVVNAELYKCWKFRAVALPASQPDAGTVMQMMQVGFSFPGGAPILRDVNLSIREGETAVLYGVSGIGKSSLLNLIAGVSQPSTGVVRIDRRSVAYVPQEIPLLDDSIRNNLQFGLPKKSDEELMRALAAAMLDGFVTSQSLGLETRIGDNGALFSGGQRQRLGVARAILRASHLLLLDEATSALDEESENQVLENLRASGIAMLIVTHRVNAHRFADRIFRLEDGALVEDTSQGLPVQEVDVLENAEDTLHEELLESC